MIEARRVLVLAPHADDEVLGCGGTLALFAERGARVTVVVVFDGALGDPDGRFDGEGYAARRAAEARAGGAHLGVTSYRFWELPEGHAPSDAELRAFVPRLDALARELRPELVLAPWAGEAHTDHRAVARAVELWLAEGAAPTEVWGYEVWSDLAPEHLVDVSGVWPAKLAALAEHDTQLAYRDLAAWCEARAHRLGAGALEAFRRFDVPVTTEVP